MKFFTSIGTVIFFSLFFYACSGTQSDQSDDNSNSTSSKLSLIDSTEHFSLYRANGYLELKVKSPFQGSKQSETYHLISDQALWEASGARNEATHSIQIPVSKVAINSTTHLGYISALGLEDVICAATNTDLAFNPVFQENVESGQIKNLGKRNIDMELLIESSPNVLFSFIINAEDYDQIYSQREQGQNVILIAEYMESKPLEKAKWIIPIAAFFGEDYLAQSIEKYAEIESKYKEMKEIANRAEEEPSVILSKPWKGTWFMAGGESFQAQFLEDANVNYLWKDKKQKASMPLAMEVVIEKGLMADYWLNPGGATSIQQLIEDDERFKKFSSVKNGRVYNISKRINAAGGNDYWESAVVNPDIILGDLIHILHPNLLPDWELFYYQQLEL